MQEQFEKTLPPDDSEIDRLWEEATFVFDTNVLLGLYTHDESTTEDLLSAIEVLQDRLFMPHQVLVEFVRNRPSRIKSASTPFDEALKFVEEWEEKDAYLEKLANQIENQPNVGEDLTPLDFALDMIADKVEEVANEIKDRIKDSREDHVITESTTPDPSEDPILDSLFDSFEESVGKGYSQEEYKAIIREADKRYTKEIPPGYGDIESDKTGDHQYGDQILWQQVLDYASEQGLDVMLVTGDTDKEDWREEELRREFRRCVGEDFKLYTPKQFLRQADNRFELNIEKESFGALESNEELRLKGKSVHEWILILDRKKVKFLYFAREGEFIRSKPHLNTFIHISQELIRLLYDPNNKLMNEVVSHLNFLIDIDVARIYNDEGIVDEIDNSMSFIVNRLRIVRISLLEKR